MDVVEERQRVSHGVAWAAPAGSAAHAAHAAAPSPHAAADDGAGAWVGVCTEDEEPAGGGGAEEREQGPGRCDEVRQKGGPCTQPGGASLGGRAGDPHPPNPTQPSLTYRNPTLQELLRPRLPAGCQAVPLNLSATNRTCVPRRPAGGAKPCHPTRGTHPCTPTHTCTCTLPSGCSGCPRWRAHATMPPRRCPTHPPRADLTPPLQLARRTSSSSTRTRRSSSKKLSSRESTEHVMRMHHRRPGSRRHCRPRRPAGGARPCHPTRSTHHCTPAHACTHARTPQAKLQEALRAVGSSWGSKPRGKGGDGAQRRGCRPRPSPRGPHFPARICMHAAAACTLPLPSVHHKPLGPQAPAAAASCRWRGPGCSRWCTRPPTTRKR
jgi:hypothetical protein